MLEETVKLLELKLPNVELKSPSVQNEISTDNKCKWQTKNVSDLWGHMHGSNTSADGEEEKIKFHYCADICHSKNELMTHRKITHEDKVPLCANFSEAKCGFQDSCWFSHDASKCKDLPKFECNLCNKSFTIKTTFMSHRK